VSPIRKVGASLLAVAIVLALIGYLNQHRNLYLGETLYNLLGDFYANTSAEIGGIAITVLIIDALYQKREINREKRDLILQLGSPDNAFAREALRKIRARKWLNDGSLSFADLRDANLEGANLMDAKLKFVDLISANLRGADLRDAYLEGANLMDAKLRSANLDGADLRGAYLLDANLRDATLIDAKLRGADLLDANLEGAELRGANLTNANLSDTQLSKAKSLEGATMPDGTEYDGRFDIKDH